MLPVAAGPAAAPADSDGGIDLDLDISDVDLDVEVGEAIVPAPEQPAVTGDALADFPGELAPFPAPIDHPSPPAAGAPALQPASAGEPGSSASPPAFGGTTPRPSTPHTIDIAPASESPWDAAPPEPQLDRAPSAAFPISQSFAAAQALIAAESDPAPLPSPDGLPALPTPAPGAWGIDEKRTMAVPGAAQAALLAATLPATPPHPASWEDDNPTRAISASEVRRALLAGRPEPDASPAMPVVHLDTSAEAPAAQPASPPPEPLPLVTTALDDAGDFFNLSLEDSPAVEAGPTGGLETFGELAPPELVDSQEPPAPPAPSSDGFEDIGLDLAEALGPQSLGPDESAANQLPAPPPLMDFGALPAAPAGAPVPPPAPSFTAEIVDAPGEVLPAFDADIEALGDLPAPPPNFDAPTGPVTGIAELGLAGLDDLPAPPPNFDAPTGPATGMAELGLAGLDDLPAPPPNFDAPTGPATGMAGLGPAGLDDLPAPPPNFDAPTGPATGMAGLGLAGLDDLPAPPLNFDAPTGSATGIAELGLAGLDDLPAPPLNFDAPTAPITGIAGLGLAGLDDLPAPPPAFDVASASVGDEAMAAAAPTSTAIPTLSSRVGALAEALESESRFADAAMLYEVQAALAGLGR